MGEFSGFYEFAGYGVAGDGQFFCTGRKQQVIFWRGLVDGGFVEGFVGRDVVLLVAAGTAHDVDRAFIGWFQVVDMSPVAVGVHMAGQH